MWYQILGISGYVSDLHVICIRLEIDDVITLPSFPVFISVPPVLNPWSRTTSHIILVQVFLSLVAVMNVFPLLFWYPWLWLFPNQSPLYGVCRIENLLRNSVNYKWYRWYTMYTTISPTLKEIDRPRSPNFIEISTLFLFLILVSSL